MVESANRLSSNLHFWRDFEISRFNLHKKIQKRSGHLGSVVGYRIAPILDIEVECGEQKSRLFRGMVVLRGTVNYCIHRCDSIQWKITYHGHGGHNPRQAPTTANTSNLHGEFVDIDTALLGSWPSLAPRSFGSFASPSHPVSVSFIPTIIRSLTQLLPRVQWGPSLETID